MRTDHFPGSAPDPNRIPRARRYAVSLGFSVFVLAATFILVAPAAATGGDDRLVRLR